MNGRGIFVLAWVMLAAVTGLNAYTAVTATDMSVRAFSLTGVFMITLTGGFMLGRAKAYRFACRLLAAAPSKITINTNAEGRRVAFIHHGDDLSTLPIPDEITNGEDALNYVMAHLLDGADDV